MIRDGRIIERILPAGVEVDESSDAFRAARTDRAEFLAGKRVTNQDRPIEME